jgi:hypothetical protein
MTISGDPAHMEAAGNRNPHGYEHKLALRLALKLVLKLALRLRLALTSRLATANAAHRRWGKALFESFDLEFLGHDTLLRKAGEEFGFIVFSDV